MDNFDGQTGAFRAETIMMVDDEPTTIDVLQMFLQGEGYEKFITTTDSRRVLDLLEEERPDVLLLNLMMPDVGGFEILSRLRADEALRGIPVIILTSSTDPATKRKALELGATDFLGKPVDPSELVLRLRNTLGVKAYGDDLGGALPLCERRGEEPCRAGARPGVSQMDGEDPRLGTIIEKFVIRLEEKLEAMEASWRARDFEELASLAHWLKGSAGTVGLDSFTEPAEALKLLAREQKEHEIEGLIRELRGMAERIPISSGHDA